MQLILLHYNKHISSECMYVCVCVSVCVCVGGGGGGGGEHHGSHLDSPGLGLALGPIDTNLRQIFVCA